MKMRRVKLNRALTGHIAVTCILLLPPHHDEMQLFQHMILFATLLTIVQQYYIALNHVVSIRKDSSIKHAHLQNVGEG